MSGMKDKSTGDYAPSRTPYLDIGRFRISSVLKPDRVWIMDTETGEGGSFEVAKLEEAIRKFYEKEF